MDLRSNGEDEKMSAQLVMHVTSKDHRKNVTDSEMENIIKAKRVEETERTYGRDHRCKEVEIRWIAKSSKVERNWHFILVKSFSPVHSHVSSTRNHIDLP
jgi:hypothetical protein